MRTIIPGKYGRPQIRVGPRFDALVESRGWERALKCHKHACYNLINTKRLVLKHKLNLAPVIVFTFDQYLPRIYALRCSWRDNCKAYLD